MNMTTTNPSSGTATPASFTLTIDGMTCGHCVRAVREALAAVPGVAVRSVAVGRAEITAPDGLTVARAVNALGETGYAAKASEALAGAAAQAVPSAGCCGGSRANAARGGCCG
jgi:Cu+-exporting ATPase